MTATFKMAPFVSPAQSFAATFERTLGRIDRSEGPGMLQSVNAVLASQGRVRLGNLAQLQSPNFIEWLFREYPVAFKGVRDALGLSLPLLETVADKVRESASNPDKTLYEASARLRALVKGSQKALLEELGPYLPSEVNAGEYHRVSLFWEQNLFEGVLFYWGIGSGTPVHNHGGSEGIDCVVDGDMGEDTYGWPDGDESPPLRAERRNRAGDVTHFTELMLHGVSNAGNQPLITLRFYTPPVDSSRVTHFDKDPVSGRLVRQVGG